MHLPHLLAWFEVLWHHAHNDTLPPVPTGNTAVSVSPINPANSAPAMGVTVAALPPGVVNTGTNQAGVPVPIPVSEPGADNTPGVASAHNGVTQRPTPVSALPPGCEMADESRGLVRLLGTFASPHYAGLLYAIDEVADCILKDSPGYKFVKAQVSMAEELDRLGETYEPCRVVGSDGRATGENILGTVMCAAKVTGGNTDKFRTVAEAYAFYSTYNPNTGGSGAGFSPKK